jgi:DNA primase
MVDFAEVKAKVSLVQGMKLLNLELTQVGEQYRGTCPACEGAGNRSLVITPTAGWYCFHSKKGGDVLSLVSHMLKISVRESAEWLLQQLEMEVVKISQPANAPVAVKKNGFDAQKYREGLATEHELLTKSGLTKEFCVERGIGVPAKGSHKGLIAIPTWDVHGHIVYIGVKEVQLPRFK